MFKSIFIPTFLVLAACASPSPSPQPAPAPPAADALIRIYESTCYFTCVSYEIEVRPDGAYKLNNMKNTRQDGQSEGKFGADVWAKAQAAFDAAHFDTKPEQITSAPKGEIPCMNDAPAVRFTRQISASKTKTVTWNIGCKAPELGVLRDALRALFRYDALVRPAS